MDCYKVLRLPPNALPDEIEEAAKKLLTIWNPIDHDDYKDVALCVVDDIKKARRILIDPVLRKHHDEQLNIVSSKMDERSWNHRAEILSDAGLRAVYCRHWIASSDASGKHDANCPYRLEWEVLCPFHNESANQISEFDETEKYTSATKNSIDSNKSPNRDRFTSSLESIMKHSLSVLPS
ncbi:uncharacterized protein NPIL_638601 [Nephila pilipes]|uniref:J domain-containing protein n=1 Tax=Nephila pilipes TaxID=299642 RepID=A0A8X6P002_NEPPI|nr:uncharacterized protein NPIL_638601 [Nephila pilipes]